MQLHSNYLTSHYNKNEQKKLQMFNLTSLFFCIRFFTRCIVDGLYYRIRHTANVVCASPVEKPN